MIQEHHWSLSEIESMLPWEREIYAGMLMKHLEDKRNELSNGE